MSSTEPTGRRLVPVAAALAVAWCAPLHAETICTHIVQAPEYPIPMGQREGERQVQARIKPGFIAEGDRLLGEGKQGEAVKVYARVFSGFQHRGVYFGSDRCLPTSFYQEAANKLRAAATTLAGQRMARGYFLDERQEYGGKHHEGALRLFLISNQYDEFVDRAFEYASDELRERDIDRELNSMVRDRLAELDRMRGSDAGWVRQYEDDRTPMLDEELVGFDKLASFDSRLQAHLAPLYPGIADFWLAEEARHHDEFSAIPKDATLSRALGAGAGAAALEQGINRLQDHPTQVERLRARANSRGEAFMQAGQFSAARDYFDVAGNAERHARADALSRDQQASQARDTAAALEADLAKMQKSEEERNSFQKDTDEMAREFGFDLDE